VAVATELAAPWWAFDSFAPREEAGVVNAPHKLYFVYELSGCDGWVSTMVGKICSISFGCVEEVAMFGGVVKGSDCCRRYCNEIPVVAMIMDTSVRCTPGGSWPYYLGSSGCTAGARCSGNTGVYIRDISPMGTDFQARYLVTAYDSGHEGAGFDSR
jgi:hypothetical protein